MLVGAFSSNAYGYPRSTNDADIVIEYQDGILSKIGKALGDDFKLDPRCARCDRSISRSPRLALY